LALCIPCLGGPGWDIHGTQGEKIGDDWVPFQCCDAGVNVNDNGGNLRYYIGSNFGCCTGCAICCLPCCADGCCNAGCCKLLCMCTCCSDSVYPIPIWENTRSQVISKTSLVVPCMAKWIPCLTLPHYIARFPMGSTAEEKTGITAAHLLFDTTFYFLARSGRMALEM